MAKTNVSKTFNSRSNRGRPAYAPVEELAYSLDLKSGFWWFESTREHIAAVEELAYSLVLDTRHTGSNPVGGIGIVMVDEPNPKPMNQTLCGNPLRSGSSIG